MKLSNILAYFPIIRFQYNSSILSVDLRNSQPARTTLGTFIEIELPNLTEAQQKLIIQSRALYELQQYFIHILVLLAIALHGTHLLDLRYRLRNHQLMLSEFGGLPALSVSEEAWCILSVIEKNTDH